MPMRGELRSDAIRSATRTGRSRIAVVIANQDVQAIAMFCAIGFLSTVNAVLLFPDFGEALARLAIFS